MLLVLPETKGKTLDEIQALFGTPESKHAENYNNGKRNEAYEPET